MQHFLPGTQDDVPMSLRTTHLPEDDLWPAANSKMNPPGRAAHVWTACGYHKVDFAGGATKAMSRNMKTDRVSSLWDAIRSTRSGVRRRIGRT